MTREANDEALRLFYKAIERDPEFAWPTQEPPTATCSEGRTAGWSIVHKRLPKPRAWLDGRSSWERDDAVALSYGGHTLGYVVGDLDDGAAFVDRALVLNSNWRPRGAPAAG
jgi:hypothetical protein